MVGMSEFADAFPRHLSAGQMRRVALARAYAVEPEVLLLDEPFVSLDDVAAERLRAMLMDIWHQRPVTVLFVTHDLTEAVSLADRVLYLAGRPAGLAADLPVSVPRRHRASSALSKDLVRQLDAFRRNSERSAIDTAGIRQ